MLFRSRPPLGPRGLSRPRFFPALPLALSFSLSLRVPRIPEPWEGGPQTDGTCRLRHFCCLRSLSQPFSIFGLYSQPLLPVTLYLLGICIFLLNFPTLIIFLVCISLWTSNFLLLQDFRAGRYLDNMYSYFID